MADLAARVSVIVPMFNRGREIVRALESVFRQTREPYEILAIDDASSDGTAETVAALRHPRVKLLRHDRNQGAAAARNTGIAAAQGDFVAFLDSDDAWDAKKIALQLDALDRAGDTAGVTGYAIEDYRTGETRAFGPRAEDATLEALAGGCVLSPGSTLMARRSAFAEIGPFDPELRRLEDWDWLIRYVEAHRLGVLPDILATVHKSSDGSRAQVVAAIARLRARHGTDLRRRSWLLGRKFESTLKIEEAASAYQSGHRARAVTLTLAALGAYPLRGGNFFALLARRSLRNKA